MEGQAPRRGEEWGVTQEKSSGRSTQPGWQWGLGRGQPGGPRLSLGWGAAEQGHGGLAGGCCSELSQCLGPRGLLEAHGWVSAEREPCRHKLPGACSEGLSARLSALCPLPNPGCYPQ